MKRIVTKRSKLYLPNLFTSILGENPSDQDAMIAAIMCSFEYGSRHVGIDEIRDFKECIKRYPAVLGMDLSLIQDVKRIE